MRAIPVCGPTTAVEWRVSRAARSSTIQLTVYIRLTAGEATSEYKSMLGAHRKLATINQQQSAPVQDALPLLLSASLSVASFLQNQDNYYTDQEHLENRLAETWAHIRTNMHKLVLQTSIT